MIKGFIVAVVVFFASVFAVGGLTAHAQTTNSTTNSTTNTTVTPTATTNTTVPSGAPATGRAQ